MKRTVPSQARIAVRRRLIPLLAAAAVICAAGVQRAHADLEVAKSIRGGLTRVDAGTQFTYVLSYRAASTTTTASPSPTKTTTTPTAPPPPAPESGAIRSATPALTNPRDLPASGRLPLQWRGSCPAR